MLPARATTTWICQSQDVPRFLKQLDALSVFPTTRIDIIAQLTSNLRTLKSKNELLIQQQSKLEHSAHTLIFPKHDVITITNIKITTAYLKQYIRRGKTAIIISSVTVIASISEVWVQLSVLFTSVPFMRGYRAIYIKVITIGSTKAAVKAAA